MCSIPAWQQHTYGILDTSHALGMYMYGILTSSLVRFAPSDFTVNAIHPTRPCHNHYTDTLPTRRGCSWKTVCISQMLSYNSRSKKLHLPPFLCCTSLCLFFLPLRHPIQCSCTDQILARPQSPLDHRWVSLHIFRIRFRCKTEPTMYI